MGDQQLIPGDVLESMSRLAGESDLFPTDPAGLMHASSPGVVELHDGGAFDLRITPVAKRLGKSTVRMLAYNGSVPGPTLLVRQGSEAVVNVTNRGDLAATVHWHGLRLENRYDGVPYGTQDPIPVGESFTYHLRFPDPGLYWYHPHLREDYGLEMGLYGCIIVAPSEPGYWPPSDRDVVLTLDDILLDDGKVAPFSRSGTTHTAMGRFGNLMLVTGEVDLALSAKCGEVLRLCLVNTAGARVFNVHLAGARMKLVGGDSGRYEHAQFVDRVLLAPSERAIVDVLVDEPGLLTLEHRTPRRTYPLATIVVTGSGRLSRPDPDFQQLITAPELERERLRLEPYVDAEPDKTLAFVAEMDEMGSTGHREGPVLYACPMHPEVTSDEPGRCPKCGMKLMPSRVVPGATFDHKIGGESRHGGQHHGHRNEVERVGDGIEWEDDMAEINRLTTTDNVRWKFIDRDTGAENATIDWRFTVGQRIKIRLINEMDSDHPMHHPFHVHGAGRFLVLTRDGLVEPNLVWKDTVLVRTGQIVDILLDVTNPGRWMAHCHIGEHTASGMMFTFDVAPSPPPALGGQGSAAS